MAMATASPFDASPPKKRARSDTNALDSSEWKRHPELYMPDGTFIVWANNVVFKVYSGLLAKHSEVFSGMVSLSNHQPSDAELYDGCPVVRVTDDPEDLAYFFEATMGTVYFHPNQPTSYRIAAGLLRLATKYMVTPLRQQAIEHFNRVIPHSIDEIGKKESFEKVFGNDMPHPFALVTLFRECQITRFLPWAFYIACKEGLPKLIGGASQDGQVIQLSHDDSRIAVLGWKSLRDESLKTRRMTVMSKSSNCRQGTCNDTLRMGWLDTVFHGVTSDAIEQWKLFTLLATQHHVISGLVPEVNAITPCQICISSWLEKERNRREQLWGRLPFIFALPPWEDLPLWEELQ